MAVDLDENTVELLADRFLEKLSAIDWAVKALERGFDSKNLRMLASMLPIDAASEIAEKEQRALAELGWDKSLPYVYMILWARRVANKILNGETDPIDGSQELYRILCSIDAHFELGAWYSIDESLWSREHFQGTGTKDSFYPGDKELVTEIKNACEDFLRKTDSNLDELPGVTFEQAEARYRNFLKFSKISTNLKWIFREDVVADGSGIAINVPLPAGNRETAKRCFELGKERNFGFAITAICTLNGDPCCFLDLPEDETDAQYRWMGNKYIKYSFSNNMKDARVIRNPIFWKIKQLTESKHGKRRLIDDIPSRHTLLPSRL